jgi:hypothetical protein
MLHNLPLKDSVIVDGGDMTFIENLHASIDGDA